MSPIWRLGKPMGKYTPSEAKITTDGLDAMEIERAVANLPEPHRSAVRWSYVYRTSPARQASVRWGVRY